MRIPNKIVRSCAAALLFTFFPAWLFAAGSQFLTEANDGAPLDIAVNYLESNTDKLGLANDDLADFVVSDHYVSRHNEVTHIYLQQRLAGIDVINGLINVNVMPDGRILSLGNRFVGNLAVKANATSPQTQPEAALASAADHLDLNLVTPRILENIGGPAMEMRFNGAGISSDDIPARLVYLPLRDGSNAVRLAWSLVIKESAGHNWWNIFVDADSGVVLDKFNWTANDEGKASFDPHRTRAAGSQDIPDGCASNCYNVFATPKDSPLYGPRTVEENPADPTASPFGWHDTNGAAGAEFTDSRGNNVDAHTDLDANNVFGGIDIRSEGGPNLIFNDPLDLNLGPETYREFAVTNLFYWNNLMHDITYQYGFDEPSGNFQTNNYGNGGAGNDAVQADAQDGSDVNNANFSTPPDGFVPRMQMYVFTYPFSQLVTVNSPGSIAGDYIANPSNNGGTANGLTADVTIVVDGTPPNDDACEAITNDLTGDIALIRWNQGACNSSVFIANAAAAGAVAAIIIDNTDEPRTNFGGSPDIPSVAIGAADGQLLVDTIVGGDPVNATIDDNSVAEPNRDSDLDAGIIAHEYGHGISNRLTGGPGSSGCLFGDEQGGEGWSDWWTLSLFTQVGDTRATVRGTGNYVSFLPIDGAGIRNFPYSTDLGINPQTYADIAATNIPHGVGEIWAAMLWEVFWNLVEKHGYDADLYSGSGGNNLAIQLVIDGMKLQNCGPTFVDARNAILAADVANNGGANQCEIWNGFAKRGLGFSSIAGTTAVGDEIEAFDLPPDIPVGCTLSFFDGFETPTPPVSNSMP